MSFRLVVNHVAVFAALTLWPCDGRAEDLCFANTIFNTPGSWPTSVFAADLDGDGDADLAVAHLITDDVGVLRNNGHGNFSSLESWTAGSSPSAVFATDLDGDGDADLVVANEGGDNVSVLKNFGNLMFPVTVNYSVGDGPSSVFAADLDGDDDADLAVANANSDNVSVLKNSGDGAFSAAANYAAGDGPSSVFAADLDGDNDVDLAIANRTSSSVSVLLNLGDGTFAAAVHYATGPYPTSVYAADLDGDNDADLAVAVVSVTRAYVSVLKNNGNGTLASKIDYTAGYYPPNSVIAADFNGDNHLDLAVTNDEPNTISVLSNNADATFAPEVSFPVGDRPSSAVAVDLNGDGDADLAVANAGTDDVAMLINCLSRPTVVTTLSNSGVGSLRAAILRANSEIGPNIISFSVAGEIQLSTPLPELNDLSGGTLIAGFSAPGASFPYTPTVIVDGSLCAGGHGLILSSDYNRVEGLTVRNFLGSGVVVWPIISNTISANRMYGNGGQGIDLGNDGITPNDPGDADGGANTLLNYPEFDLVTETDVDTFSLHGTAEPFARVELFLATEPGNPSFPPEATNHGPAYQLLKWTIASASGDFQFDTIAKPEWSRVTATATDSWGNTSEFAENLVLIPDPLRITGYSESTPSLQGVKSIPYGTHAFEVTVYGPPDSVGNVDSIGASFNTFGSRASYDSLTDFDSGGLPDVRVRITSPDSGEYQIKFVLIGSPGNYHTGTAIGGHAEVQRQVGFGAVGQADSSTYRLVPPPSCSCPNQGDIDAGGFTDAVDLAIEIDIVFFGVTEFTDPACPTSRSDFNDDGFSDAVDLAFFIDHVFFGGSEPVAPCAP